jgi:uncharacterized coiled-coil DUF342 family protein
MPQTLRLEFAKSNTKVQKPKSNNQSHSQNVAALAAQLQSAHTQLIPLNRKLFFLLYLVCFVCILMGFFLK